MKLFEMRQERAAKAKAAQALLRKAQEENREETAEERSQREGFDAQIADLSRRIGVEELVDKYAEFGHAGEPEGRRSAPIPTDGPDLDGPKHRYSLLRAFRMAADARQGIGKLDGLEAEVSQEIGRRVGKQPNGIFIPWNLATHRDQLPAGAEKRVFNTTSGTGGIANILGTELIDILRNRMVVRELGARVMTDMVGGTFSLPKRTAASSAYWVAESTAPTGSNQTLGQVTWTPKTLGAYTDISRKFMLQTSMDAEMLAREDLAAVVALELDRVAINGSGSGQEPQGILQNSSVTTEAIGTNGGAPTWDMIVNLESDVAAGNADLGKLGYLTSTKGRGKLKRTAKIGSTFPIYLWENNQLNDYRALASNQVPSNLTKGTLSGTGTALVFGNWDSATYAFWGGLDVLVDPYTGSSTGTVRIVLLQDLDFELRYTQSFAKCVDIDPS